MSFLPVIDMTVVLVLSINVTQYESSSESEGSQQTL